MQDLSCFTKAQGKFWVSGLLFHCWWPWGCSVPSFRIHPLAYVIFYSSSHFPYSCNLVALSMLYLYPQVPSTWRFLQRIHWNVSKPIWAGVITLKDLVHHVSQFYGEDHLTKYESSWTVKYDYFRIILELLILSSTVRLSVLTAAATSLQLCPTLCDPIDSSLPGSSVPEILQARILEWVAISFSISFSVITTTW